MKKRAAGERKRISRDHIRTDSADSQTWEETESVNRLAKNERPLRRVAQEVMQANEGSLELADRDFTAIRAFSELKRSSEEA